MNTNQLTEISTQAFNGEINFGQVVAQMIEAKVESYRVDFVRKETTYYMPNGESFVSSLPYEDHKLAEAFCLEGIQAAIQASQRGELKYRQFIPKALDSGITSYVVYIKGKKVVYFGRNGESHTELFPQAK
jgi:uncharacterized protein YbcV (DUF1398 family)